MTRDAVQKKKTAYDLMDEYSGRRIDRIEWSQTVDGEGQVIDISWQAVVGHGTKPIMKESRTQLVEFCMRPNRANQYI